VAVPSLFPGRGAHLAPPVVDRRGVLPIVLACLLGSCAARAPARPAGSFVADSDAVRLFEQATSSCAGLRTLTAEIGLSGRAAGERLRGRLHAGFAAPGSVRLEAVAPFGPPVFILAAERDQATLLFPRDGRVLPATPVADVLARLTGLDLGAEDLRLVISGCLAQAPAADGRAWPDGWKAVSVGPDRTAYLRQQAGAWRVVAADVGAWRVDYRDHLNGVARTVRVRSSAGTGVDLTARLDQLQMNVELPASAFTLDVPADAQRITLDDLRSVAPLRGSP
jgi:outer membrane biogenesis lipoprotein LolB